MNVRLGILGGGQLALYLCGAARRLGVRTCVFIDAPDSPAVTRADQCVYGDMVEPAPLEEFIDSCDVITFDKEAIPDEALAMLETAVEQGRVAVRPGVAILRLLKDKGLQKAWLVEQQLPTLPFITLSGEASESLAALQAQFGDTLVQKARRGGYDGRGVQMLNPGSTALLWDIPSIIEPCLTSCREISVLVARALNGEMISYPPVGMEFDPQLNAVSVVSIPVDLASQKCDAAVTLAERTIELLGGTGVFAVEMFVTPEAELLINEISPRVHNSGHLTLDACNVSQFEQHVRAVTGLPLLSVELLSAAAMLNILYEEAMRPHCPAEPRNELLEEFGVSLYWYGKIPGKLGRKMGHINAMAATTDQAKIQAANALASLTRDNGFD